MKEDTTENGRYDSIIENCGPTLKNSIHRVDPVDPYTTMTSASLLSVRKSLQHREFLFSNFRSHVPW